MGRFHSLLSSSCTLDADHGWLLFATGRYFHQDGDDLRCLVEGVRAARNVVAQQAFNGISTKSFLLNIHYHPVAPLFEPA